MIRNVTRQFKDTVAYINIELRTINKRQIISYSSYLLSYRFHFIGHKIVVHKALNTQILSVLIGSGYRHQPNSIGIRREN